MDILLINADDRNPVSNIPWGVLSVGSYLSGVRGRKVAILDASVDGEPRALAEIGRRAPDLRLVGVSCMSRYTPFLKGVADTVKAANPACRVIVGGPHAILSPETTVAYPNIDFVCYGEGEHSVEALIQVLEKGGTDYSGIPGILFKDKGRIVRTLPAPAIGFYDIDYRLLDRRIESSFGQYIQVLTGRGCSYHCTFCFNAVRAEKWRPRPAAEVARELEAIVDRYDPKVVYFRDENFFQSKQRTRDFIRIYKEKGFRFRWRATCRADYLNDGYLNPDVLKDLADINCEALKFGLESGSERVLRGIKKKLKISQIERAVRWLRDEPRITKYYSFLIGMPGETLADYKSTLRLVGWILKADPQATIIGPQYYRLYPGGELYDSIVKEYAYSIPQNFEAWCKLYDDPANDDGWDKGIEYPWVPAEGRWLAKNASELIAAYRRIFASPTAKDWSPIKRLVLRAIQRHLDARFRFGYYCGMVDFRVIGWLTRFYGWLTFRNAGRALKKPS